MTSASNDWVVLGRFVSPSEALFYKSVLDGYGIPSFVENDYTGALYAPMFGQAGCVFLLTPADRLEEARLLLEHPEEVCPECGEESEAELENTSLKTAELFVSIQGESTWAGQLCGFIRLTGCNLRCVWCDTTYAYDGGRTMSVAAVLEEVNAWGVSLVEITGGEPLLQAGCPVLAQALLRAGYTVLVETNGSQPLSLLPAGVIRIMDIKCPDSGEADSLLQENLDLLTDQDEVKFVLASSKDYQWAVDMVERHALAERCKAVLFSPVPGRLVARDLAEWMRADKPSARLQLQLHKLIWPSELRGV